MRVYLDTGVFVDYLIYRGHVGHFLRKKGRRNRSVRQLQQDATECLAKIAKSHEGFTSCLTFCEAEEALFSQLKRASKGIKDGNRFAVVSSRSSGLQILMIRDLFGLKILDLSEDVVEKEMKETALQMRGMRAGDSLHLITAITNNAEVIITTDKHLLSVNGVFQNNIGRGIQCLDTNAAKNLL